jgi:hypothetical protein
MCEPDGDPLPDGEPAPLPPMPPELLPPVLPEPMPLEPIPLEPIPPWLMLPEPVPLLPEPMLPELPPAEPTSNGWPCCAACRLCSFRWSIALFCEVSERDQRVACADE